ncbi:MAG TPA: SLC13 family permease [Candidatus Acidoferrales bacterium]|nr:SLC13 family permease [Candidatus Acidoferrales bacterium]
MSPSSWLTVITSLAAVLGMILWPRRSQEWIWPCGAGALLLLMQTLTPAQAWSAVLRGSDVYAFLAGIMILAELARHEGLFDWLATHALRAAGGSQERLFALVYVVGCGVTALLSNDTTAVVLTPAIGAALARTRTDALPYLFACAFVANAASFSLPISNPANLVVFERELPPLHLWLGAFALPSLGAIVATYLTLRALFRSTLRAPLTVHAQPSPLPAAAAISATAIGIAAVALLVASALHAEIGLTALAGSLMCLIAVSVRERGAAAFVIRHVAWQIVPLVAGLFVIVEALDRAGVIGLLRAVLAHGKILTAAVIAAAANLFNNLPVALAGGFALQSSPIHPTIAHTVLVAVDLGPNISVTGSLATMLWLIALRRNGYDVSPWRFLQIGILTTLPALALAVLLVR